MRGGWFLFAVAMMAVALLPSQASAYEFVTSGPAPVSSWSGYEPDTPDCVLDLGIYVLPGVQVIQDFDGSTFTQTIGFVPRGTFSGTMVPVSFSAALDVALDTIVLWIDVSVQAGSDVFLHAAGCDAAIFGLYQCIVNFPFRSENIVEGCS
jgi:hypothetical protein